MTKQDILDYFGFIDYAYNESGRLESLSRMLDELLKDQEVVVHCKDCKFFIGEGHYCKIRGMGRALKEDDFCSDGRSVKWE